MQTRQTSLPGPCRQVFAQARFQIASLKQSGVPAGSLGDFFGPGATAGGAFAAQIGERCTFSGAIRNPGFSWPIVNWYCKLAF
jgi:hypothetical protein